MVFDSTKTRGLCLLSSQILEYRNNHGYMDQQMLSLICYEEKKFPNPSTRQGSLITHASVVKKCAHIPPQLSWQSLLSGPYEA